jgi:anti-anti-sigma regulatory factor
MSETTFTCDVRGKTTVLSVRGSLHVDACGDLEDMLEMCRFMRGAGPMIVDLSEVGELSFPALVALRRAADSARRTGRPMILRELRAQPTVQPTSRATAAR